MIQITHIDVATLYGHRKLHWREANTVNVSYEVNYGHGTRLSKA